MTKRAKGPVCFLLFVSLPLGTALAQDAAPRGDAAKGKILYESTGCYECHTYAGIGSSQGSRLVPPLAFGAFLKQLRLPRAVMPPYEAAVLSDAQIADIYAYVSSLPRTPGTAKLD